MSDEFDGTPADDELNTVFWSLAHHHRRYALLYFFDISEEVAKFDELIEYVATHSDGSVNRRKLEVELHHVILPKLAEIGVVEYDRRSRTVRYEGDPVVERCLDVVAELETNANHRC